jgi:hypothetical protein
MGNGGYRSDVITDAIEGVSIIFGPDAADTL